jgi:hypothetical protein
MEQWRSYRCPFPGNNTRTACGHPTIPIRDTPPWPLDPLEVAKSTRPRHRNPHKLHPRSPPCESGPLCFAAPAKCRHPSSPPRAPATATVLLRLRLPPPVRPLLVHPPPLAARRPWLWLCGWRRGRSSAGGRLDRSSGGGGGGGGGACECGWRDRNRTWWGGVGSGYLQVEPAQHLFLRP